MKMTVPIARIALTHGQTIRETIRFYYLCRQGLYIQYIPLEAQKAAAKSAGINPRKIKSMTAQLLEWGWFRAGKNGAVHAGSVTDITMALGAHKSCSSIAITQECLSSEKTFRNYCSAFLVICIAKRLIQVNRAATSQASDPNTVGPRDMREEFLPKIECYVEQGYAKVSVSLKIIAETFGITISTAQKIRNQARASGLIGLEERFKVLIPGISYGDFQHFRAAQHPEVACSLVYRCGAACRQCPSSVAFEKEATGRMRCRKTVSTRFYIPPMDITVTPKMAAKAVAE